jgi:hypothetical protein
MIVCVPMSAKAGKKPYTVRLPGDVQKKVEALADRNHLSANDVIRLCLLQVLPVIEREGITIKPGKAT